jgi:glycosyltransferase involved in cell wall biosynthesis
MRILQVLDGLGAGGAERLVLELCTWIQARGHTVLVANLSTETVLQSVFEGRQVIVEPASKDEGLWRFYPRRLISIIRRFQPDVVHCHHTAWPKAAVACWWAQVPCVFTLHGHHSDWLRRHRRRLQFAARTTAYCVGVSPGVEKLLIDMLGVPMDKALCIHNGVPDIYMVEPPPPPWSSSIPSQDLVVGMVGRFDGRYKDQVTLARAMMVVREQLPQVHLVFLGDGPHRPAVERLVANLGMGRYVHFLGLRRDVPALLHYLDVFVLSSRTEGESLAILEAMSAQRPIVATAVGGTPGLLANGECGLLVPPGDAPAMAQAIVELLTNKTKAGELARRARERFLREYTIDRMGEQYLELYREAASRR